MAPIAASVSTVRARKRPSASSASAASVTLSRAWSSAMKLSVRSPIQATGRPRCRTSHSTSAYSRNSPPFSPKPPPTSGGEVTRSCRSGTLSTAPASTLRTWCGVCSGAVRCQRCAPSSQEPIATRGSRGLAWTRWLTRRSRVTWSAFAMACRAAAASPTSKVKLQFSGMPGQSCGAPGAPARAVSVTGSSGSYVTPTASAASSAALRDVATAAATASPTKRTRSVARMRCGGSRMSRGRPAASRGRLTQGMVPRPAASSSAPVTMARTPGMARAASVSMERRRACACGERNTTSCAVPGGTRSPVKRPRPRSRRPSSRRWRRDACPKRSAMVGLRQPRAAEAVLHHGMILPATVPLGNCASASLIGAHARGVSPPPPLRASMLKKRACDAYLARVCLLSPVMTAVSWMGVAVSVTSPPAVGTWPSPGRRCGLHGPGPGAPLRGAVSEPADRTGSRGRR